MYSLSTLSIPPLDLYSVAVLIAIHLNVLTDISISKLLIDYLLTFMIV